MQPTEGSGEISDLDPGSRNEIAAATGKEVNLNINLSTSRLVLAVNQ